MKSIKERLDKFAMPEPNTGCWLWTGSLRSTGYGQINIKGRNSKAHRLSYEEYVGPIPNGFFVCHTCDNRLCINPEHLFVGTHRQNQEDMAIKLRQGCAKLNPEKVKKIRKLFTSGVKIALLAKSYDIDRKTIRSAIQNKTWKHVK